MNTFAGIVKITLLLVVAVTIARAQSTGISTPADVRQAILARLAEIQHAAESMDAEKVFDYVLPNDSGVLAQNGRLILTRDEAREATARGFRGLQTAAYRFDQQHVALLSPTIALATGEGMSSATTDDGRTFSGRFVQSVVFILKDGEWMVYHAHRSFVPSK
jgi:ketosteroid isomerase-like protein